MATPDDMMQAIQHDDTTQASALIAADPMIVNARNADGVSMVLYAQYYGRTDMVTLFVEHNAQLDVYEASAIGNTARAAGWLVMQPLLANSFSPDGYPPLTLAAFFGHLEVTNVLLEYHADPNTASNNAMHVAPLHSAVANNHYAVAARLVEAGANVNAVQADGFTPLMGAAQNGNVEMVNLLRAHGADVNARVDKHAATYSNMTALEIAQQANATDVIPLLAG